MPHVQTQVSRQRNRARTNLRSAKNRWPSIQPLLDSHQTHRLYPKNDEFPFPKKLYQGRTSLLILMEIWGRPEPSAISSWWCILISVPCFFCSSNLCLVYPDCLWVVPHPMWSLAQILKNIQWAKQLFMQLQTPRVGISNHIHPQISHSFYHLHVQKEQKPIKMGGFQASSRIFVGENIPCLPGSNHLQRPRVDVRSWPRNPWVIHIYGRNEVNPIMNINEHHIDII